MSDQVIIAILGILALIAGGLGKYIQSSGEAKLQALQIELEKAKGANQKSASDERQTDKIIASSNQLLYMLGKTIDKFDKFLKYIGRIGRLIKRVETNVDDWHLEIKTLIELGIEQIKQHTATQREALEKSRHAEFLAFANEFATHFVVQQKAQRIDKNLFVFPSPNHPGWKYRYATPTYTKITFFNAPWMDDTTPIPGVEIDGDGELVHVIEHYVHGWHVVSKTKNGIDFPGIGYVPEYAVRLTEVKGEEH